MKHCKVIIMVSLLFFAQRCSPTLTVSNHIRRKYSPEINKSAQRLNVVRFCASKIVQISSISASKKRYDKGMQSISYTKGIASTLIISVESIRSIQTFWWFFHSDLCHKLHRLRSSFFPKNAGGDSISDEIGKTLENTRFSRVLVETTGLEPVTSCVWSRRSNQLS